MGIKLSIDQADIQLPNIDFFATSEQASSQSFLKAAKLLNQQMKQIQLVAKAVLDFENEPFNLVTFGLFSKICSHYYSYVILEINRDLIGSKLLLEHLCEASITLTFFLEERDSLLLSEYTSASISQAHFLLSEVTKQLHQFPHHPELLRLKAQLESFLSKYQAITAELQQQTNTSSDFWELQLANITAKRAAVVGLNFLLNPARNIALKAMPASWLELQLNDCNSLEISFKNLRDVAHLCLHATQAFLEEVIAYQDVPTADTKRQQQLLNRLYEWFYEAYSATNCTTPITSSSYYQVNPEHASC